MNDSMCNATNPIHIDFDPFKKIQEITKYGLVVIATRVDVIIVAMDGFGGRLSLGGLERKTEFFVE